MKEFEAPFKTGSHWAAACKLLPSTCTQPSTPVRTIDSRKQPSAIDSRKQPSAIDFRKQPSAIMPSTPVRAKPLRPCGLVPALRTAV
jgi:hypothetical protein